MTARRRSATVAVHAENAARTDGLDACRVLWLFPSERDAEHRHSVGQGDTDPAQARVRDEHGRVRQDGGVLHEAAHDGVLGYSEVRALEMRADGCEHAHTQSFERGEHRLQHRSLVHWRRPERDEHEWMVIGAGRRPARVGAGILYDRTDIANIRRNVAWRRVELARRAHEHAATARADR